MSARKPLVVAPLVGIAEMPAGDAVPVLSGGTGATTPGAARAALNQGTVALASAASISTNAAAGNVFTLTLGQNATLSNPSGLAAGASYAWIVKQDAIGSRTLAYGSAFKWPGGVAPTLSTAANATDMIVAVSDGSVLFAVLSPGFA